MSNRTKVKTTVRTYENSEEDVIVRSHHIYRSRAEIQIGKQKVMVEISDMIKALNNAGNA